MKPFEERRAQRERERREAEEAALHLRRLRCTECQSPALWHRERGAPATRGSSSTCSLYRDEVLAQHGVEILPQVDQGDDKP